MLRNICIIFLYLIKTIKDKIILHKSLPSEVKCRDKACIVRAFLGCWALASLTTNL